MRSQRTTFTLIELLVVIAIVAILASLLLPSLNRAREHARKIVCIQRLRHLAMASFEYGDDYDGAVPHNELSSYGRHCFSNVRRSHMASNYGLPTVDDWFCPEAAARMSSSEWTKSNTYARGDNYVHWGTVASNNPSLMSYDYWVGPYRTQYILNKGKWVNNTVKRFSDTVVSSERIIWSDALSPPGVSAYGFSPWFTSVNNHANAVYYPEGGHLAMCDGHVEWREIRFGDNDRSFSGQYYPYRP